MATREIRVRALAIKPHEVSRAGSMSVERHTISVSQFCGLLEIDPARFLAVERQGRTSPTLTLVMEPEEQMNTSGAFPQLNTGGKKIGKGKGGKKKC